MTKDPHHISFINTPAKGTRSGDDGGWEVEDGANHVYFFDSSVSGASCTTTKAHSGEPRAHDVFLINSCGVYFAVHNPQVYSGKISGATDIQRGSGTIPAGKLSTTLNVSGIASDTQIFVVESSLTGGQSLTVNNRTDNSFTVFVPSAYSQNITFDWWVVKF